MEHEDALETMCLMTSLIDALQNIRLTVSLNNLLLVDAIGKSIPGFNLLENIEL